MMQFDRISLGKKAKELGFVRDTFEKVCRLVDVLAFFQNDSLLANNLALKGGTAINLTVFELPRLSVDIDLDYSRNVDRDTMTNDRKQITVLIQKYMTANGYSLSSKSKSYHALDSFVYDYINAGGVKDNLKIEINYMLRCHLLPLSTRSIFFSGFHNEVSALCLDPLEIFSAKTTALLNRAAPRDLYDLSNVIKRQMISNSDTDLFRRCVAFYATVSSEKVPTEFCLESIDSITRQKIRTSLDPVLRRSECFDLPEAKSCVKSYLKNTLVPQDSEIEFWKLFSKGMYHPEILFTDINIIERVKDHPMAHWKCINRHELS